ncbi:MAG: hypothetical protein JO362_02995 [Streptomycetaceae bacterium]|nr:hypothetical protein [Streptomycetaceae bacterium]
MVAEHACDHGGRGLEDELSQGGDAAAESGDASFAEGVADGGGVYRASCSAAGEEPGARWVGGGVLVRPLVEVVPQECGEGFGDGQGRIADAEPCLAVFVQDVAVVRVTMRVRKENAPWQVTDLSHQPEHLATELSHRTDLRAGLHGQPATFSPATAVRSDVS